MHESIVFCSSCTMSSYRKFTFAISSPGEFLVFFSRTNLNFSLTEIQLITKQLAANCNWKISEEDVKKFAQKQSKLDRLIQNNWCSYGTTGRRPGSGRQKWVRTRLTTVTLSDNITVVSWSAVSTTKLCVLLFYTVFQKNIHSYYWL